MTDSPSPDVPAKLTTDPPRPPGTPDVDELVGDPTPAGATDADRTEPADEDVDEDAGAPEPPD